MWQIRRVLAEEVDIEEVHSEEGHLGEYEMKRFIVPPGFPTLQNP